MLSLPFWQQKGGVLMNNISDLLISIIANVVAYYICKWLDNRNNGDNE